MHLKGGEGNEAGDHHWTNALRVCIPLRWLMMMFCEEVNIW